MHWHPLAKERPHTQPWFSLASSFYFQHLSQLPIQRSSCSQLSCPLGLLPKTKLHSVITSSIHFSTLLSLQVLFLSPTLSPSPTLFILPFYNVPGAPVGLWSTSMVPLLNFFVCCCFCFLFATVTLSLHSANSFCFVFRLYSVYYVPIHAL